MAIRMEKDQPDPRRDDRKYRPQPEPQPEDPQPKKKAKIPILWVIMGAFAAFKKPKLIVPLLIAFGAYYLWTSGFFSGGSQSYDYQASTEELLFGAELNEEEYDKAFVSEPLAVGSSGLPTRADLRTYAPEILHQGRQGSCSGWASAYGARTISYAQATGQSPDRVAFSPSFLYNQIALPRCQGALLTDAMAAMQQIGSLPFKDFGYTDRTCSIEPDYGDRQAAAQYRIKGYNRLTMGAYNYKPDLEGIKQHLAQGAPVVIGMMVGQSFQYNMMGKEVWTPTRNDYNGYGLGGHAMALVGYDDRKHGGAFEVMNSWGKQWGNGGYAWVRYQDFNHFVKEAYGLYPEGRTKTYDSDRLEVEFALVDNATQRIIPLRQKDEIVFSTVSPIRKGSKFKMAITNSVECYTYIFGMETNGESYVLFPYTNKHSPYCGITGTRVFPKDYSMTPDQVGNKDYIAIVVSKQPLDYETVNRRINASRGSNYMYRMVDSMMDEFVPGCDFDVDGSVYFNCDTEGKNLLGVIVEIDKI